LGKALGEWAKFFSLSGGPALESRLRREVLSLGASSRPRTPGEQAWMETCALAVTAAADKGLRLSPHALAEYAAALDPESPGEKQDGAGDREERREPLPETRCSQTAGFQPGAEGAWEDLPPGTVLDLLNRVPGRGGRRWIVLPFSCRVEGKQYRLSLGLLLRESPSVPGPEMLIVTIRGEDGWSRRFSLVRGDGTPGGLFCTLRVSPPFSPLELAALEKHLKEEFPGARVEAAGG